MSTAPPPSTPARDAVLARVRAALGPDPEQVEVARHYRTGDTTAPGEVVRRFAERVDEYRATVHRSDVAGLPPLLATIVGVAARVGVPAGLPAAWTDGLPAVRRDDGGLSVAAIDELDAVVTGCARAIAETGTIVLDGSPDQGRRALTLVPDHHVCVVPVDRIDATVPQAFARLVPTRPLTLISGPSATSDIELDRVEGVHGPRRLDVVLLDG
ncbi:LutC/YkgG family protein [Egicoccus halophilus]|uniref:Lactate utilization protein C n=1 Tax=Egicoccus halophilus TaxID=1670830 RepID=A0A8J3EUQ9_9ACTN|nr:LUD domain-containing protein [Egicoccus halophilus]GGI07690.1 lactate utilization protein C [Egicoccus halophilus]